MKFVKDRKVYDTDTADAIHSWEEPDDQELFATSYNEVLYRSPKPESTEGHRWTA